MKKIILLSMSLLIVALSACQGKRDVPASDSAFTFMSADGPLGAFKEPITLTAWFKDPDVPMAGGDTVDNNIWRNAIAKDLNINFDFEWTASAADFPTKVNLSVASGSLPDYITGLNNEMYIKLARAGKLADISEAYQNYASPLLRKTIEDVDDVFANMLKVDGQIYGMDTATVPGPTIGYIRQDWLDNLNLPLPKTAENLFAAMDAFANQDPDRNGENDTHGLGTGRGLLGGISSPKQIFGMYNAYPDIWLEGGGKLTYGSLEPEIKDALARLHDFYEKGIIPKEFFTISEWDTGATVLKPRPGVIFGYFWGPSNFYQSTAEEEGAKWTIFPIPAIDGSYAKTSYVQALGNLSAMKKGTKYPEAVVKLYNFVIEKMTQDISFAQERKGEDGQTMSNVHFNRFIGDAYVDRIQNDQYKTLWSWLEAGKAPSEAHPVIKVLYDRIKEYEVSQDPALAGLYYQDNVGGSRYVVNQVLEAGAIISDAYYGPATEALSKRLPRLLAKRDEIFVKIITGEVSVEDGFLEWQSYWESNGGKDVTADVNQWFVNK